MRSNIAAEARARIVYEQLINFTTDSGTKDALQFLITREIAHTKAFIATLENRNKPRFMIGNNSGGDLQVVEAPAVQDMTNPALANGSGRVDDRTAISAVVTEMVEELLVERPR